MQNEIVLQKSNVLEIFEFCNSHIMELNEKLDNAKQDINKLLKGKENLIGSADTHKKPIDARVTFKDVLTDQSEGKGKRKGKIAKSSNTY